MPLRVLYLFIVLIVSAGIVYRPALGNGFVGDDKYLIVKNDFVKSWNNLPRLFKENYISTLKTLARIGQGDVGSGEVSCRQVCTLSFFADYSIWKLRPFGFHLTNVLLHILNALLVYALALRLNLSKAGAAFASLVFVLHPVNNEVIAVITSRDDSVAFLFYGLAVLFYQSFRNSGYKKLSYGLVSLLTFFLALFSKEIAVTLPFIIIVYDYCLPLKDGRRLRERLKFYLPYFGLLAFYLFVWFFIMPPSRAGMMDYFGADGISVVATLAKILGLYLCWLIFPWDIPATIADQGIIVRNFLNPQVLLSMVGVLMIGLLIAMAYQRKRMKLLFVLLWPLITLSPVLVLPWMLNVLYATRFLYIPMIGFCFILGMVWDAVEKQSKRPYILYFLAAGLLIFYASATMNKLPIWKDDLTLSLERLRYYPHSPLALINAGAAFEDRAMPAEARVLYEQAVRVDPHCPECHNQLGLLFLKLGDTAKAVNSFRQAFLIDPDYEEAANNFCSMLGQQKNFSQAETCFQNLLTRRPKSIQAYYNLGIVYTQQEKIREAISVWEKGLRLEPKNEQLREIFEFYKARTKI